MNASKPTTSRGALWLVRQLVADYRRAPLLLAGVLVAMVYQIAFSLMLPLVTRHLLDQVLPTHDQHALAVVASFLGLAVVFRVAATTLQERCTAVLVSRTMVERRTRMFDNLLRKTAGEYARVPTVSLLAAFSGGVTAVEVASMRSVPRATYTVLNVLASITLLGILDVRFAAFAVLTLVVGFVGPRRLGAGAATASDRRRAAEGRVLATVQESIHLHAVLRTYGAQPWVVASHTEQLDELRRRLYDAMLANSRVEIFTGLTLTVSQVGVICAGALLVVRGHLTAGEFIAYTALLGSIAASALNLSALMPPLMEAARSLSALGHLLDPPPRQSPTLMLTPLAECIRLDHVTFSYGGERNEVDDVSLEIPAGASVAFVGPSGSGKSTVLSMITRTNQPSRGHVMMDGRDLETVAPESLYAQMSIVAQESILFNASVRENIRIGRLAASDAEVEEAARLAEVHDAIQALPRGYDTVVGERGGGLSGGQRQRIAIARALVRAPRILVLDEATSALDPVTEDAIARMLKKVGQRLTIISVTHRLATVAHFDRIYVMQDGMVADSGAHDALLARPGTYRNLWQKQSGVRVTASGDATLTPALLASMPLFEAMTEKARAQLADQFVTLQVPDNYELFRVSDVGDAFYVIARGRVRIEVAGRPVRVLDDGDSFGEIALLEDGLRTASATTAAPSTLLMLSRQRFHEIVSREPGLAEALRAKAHGHRVDDRNQSD